MVRDHKYYCQNCGSQIKPTDIICSNCGKKLSEVGRRIEVTIVENITLSDSAETSLIIDPATMGMLDLSIPFNWDFPLKLYPQLEEEQRQQFAFNSL